MKIKAFDNKYVKYLLLSAWALIIALLLFFGLSFFWWNNSDKNPWIQSENPWYMWYFTTYSGDFDKTYKKVPENAENITFYFNTDVNSNTVNNKNINIEPALTWTFSSEKNKIIFTPETKLEKNHNYSFTFSKALKNDKWDNLLQEKLYNVQIINAPKIIKILPEENSELSNLDQSILVLFNAPMVPLASLDEQDSWECPIEITPKVEWKCKWTSTSSLEFIPTKQYTWFSDYSVNIKKDSNAFLYALDSDLESNFSTPDFKFNVKDYFNPTKWLKISTNFDIPLDSLKQNLNIKSASWEELAFNIEKNNNSNSSFIVKLTNNNFEYSSSYTINIKPWINVIWWNKKTKSEINYTRETINFLTDKKAYKAIYNDKWEKTDTKFYRESNIGWIDVPYFIPQKDVFFNLNFNEEVKLDKNNFVLYWPDWMWLYPKSINYNKIKPEKNNDYWKKIDEEKLEDNKKSIKIELPDLKKNSLYDLVIRTPASKSLKEKIIIPIKTRDDFWIKSFKILGYNKACLYVSDTINLNYNSLRENIVTQPKSQIKSIDSYEYIPWDLRKKDNVDLEKEWYCKEAPEWQDLYVINLRLAPYMKYNFTLKTGITDRYFNHLKKEINKEFITGDIKEEDKYVYNGLTRPVNVIPLDEKIVTNIQTINTDSVTVEVCELDMQGYTDFKFWWKYNPKCVKKYEKTLETKNNFWNLTNNKFDIEKDIVWKKLNSKIILIRWSSDGRFNLDHWYKDDQREFRNIYVRSNLALALEKADNKNILLVTDLFWQKVINNIKPIFYKENYNYSTNKDSIEKINVKYTINKQTWAFEFKEDVNLIVVWDKDNFWILSTDNDFAYNGDLNYVWGQDSSQKDYLYLYTDRPLYKPGDTVYVKGLLRYFDFNWYKKSSIKTWKLKVISSDYKEVLTLNIKIDKNSNFNTKFTLPKDVKLWRFKFEFEGKYEKWTSYNYIDNSWEFFIEEYRKPDFKVDAQAVNNKLKLIWDKTSFIIKPSYYFGGKMTNTSAEVEITTQDYFFDAKDYSNYQFWEWYKYFACLYWWNCWYDDRYIDNKNFDIDENWEWKFEYNYPTVDRYEYFDNDYIVNWEKIYTYNFSVKDPNTQKTVTKKVSEILHSTNWYIWLNTKYYQEKNNINISWVILDLEAKPKANTKAKIKIIKQEWKNIKKEGVDWVFYNEYSLVETPISEKEVKSDNKWKFNLKNIKLKNAWNYKIEAIYTWSNNKIFLSSSNIYAAWKDFVSFNNWNNDTTTMAVEKQLLKTWDTAEFTVQSPVNNWTIMITVEKDDGILDYFVEKIDSNAPHFKVKIKDNYYPNVYFKAYLLGKDWENPLPVYKRALWIVKVSTDYKKLNVKVNSDKTNYLPWAQVKLNIKITDQEGKPVANTNWSIAIVDESLLALKWNSKKNPFAFFYDMRRYLWVNTYLSLVNLIEKLEVVDATQWEKWWDWEKLKWWSSTKKRWTFKDTAYWLADFNTDENWNAEIVSPALPDNLTTWNVEIVANKADTNQIWIWYSSFKTSKNLLISDNLPRFFWSNDKITLSPVIFNKSDKDSSIKVSLTEDNFEIIWEKSKVIILKKWESQTVNFDVKVKDIAIMWNTNSASSKVNIKAENSITLDVDEIEKILPIRETSTKEIVATSWKATSNSFSEKIDLTGFKNTAWNLNINYSASLLWNIVTAVNALKNYPYGCSEQKTSAILPTIFIKQLYNNADLEFDLTKQFLKKYIDKNTWYIDVSLDDVIKEYLIWIYKFQNNDGGFVYFTGTYKNLVSDFYLTSYLVSSLKEFEKIWYKLDNNSINKATNYLKTRLEKNRKENCFVTKYNNCEYSYSEKLSAINALLDSKTEEKYAYKAFKTLEYKEENFNNLDKLNYALLISKLIKTDITQEEKNILEKKALDILNKIITNNLVYNPRWAFIEWYSSTDMTAKFIEVASNIWLEKFEDIDEIIYKMIKYLNSNKTESWYGSTQNNINVVKAVIKYLENSWELKNVKIIANLKLNSTEIATQKIDNTNKLEVFNKNIELKDFKKQNDFVIEKNWSGNIYYDLVLNYYKDSRLIKARDEWFGITVKYYDYNEYTKFKALQEEEQAKINSWDMSYSESKYQKDIISYLTELKEFKVGELVFAHWEIINNETRKNVYLESFIPAWTELVNTKLETESLAKKVKNYSLDKTELRNDRFFGFRNYFYPGKHNFNYILRATHAWEYQLKPTKVWEFYTPEVFWRTSWKVVIIK